MFLCFMVDRGQTMCLTRCLIDKAINSVPGSHGWLSLSRHSQTGCCLWLSNCTVEMHTRAGTTELSPVTEGMGVGLAVGSVGNVVLSTQPEDLTPIPKIYIKSQEWWCVFAIPVLGMETD